MSFGDSLSTCSTRYESRSERGNGNVIYNANHLIDVLYHNGLSLQKNILFIITNLDNALKVKARDTSDYAFNYSLVVDRSTFDLMKREQSLDIVFNEFQPQIIELLKQAGMKKMLMRMEVMDSVCKVVFYEKSRIKSLIFLTMDLQLTNQRELIEEMANTITQLKDSYGAISTQLNLSQNKLHETELLLKNSVVKNCQIEKQFRKDLDLILQTLLTNVSKTESRILLEITKITQRHQKILQDVETLKDDNTRKLESSARLVQSMQNLRFESDVNARTIDELRTEIDSLKTSKLKIEQNYLEMRHRLNAKENENEGLLREKLDLKRKLQDASMLIDQKTKTSDEIGKDLVQANQMLVNFNNHYDVLVKETNELKEKLVNAEAVIEEQSNELLEVKREYERYRNTYNAREVDKLHHEIFKFKNQVEELEKQNKEVLTLNNLLTKKLSSGEILDPRKLNNWQPPRS